MSHKEIIIALRCPICQQMTALWVRTAHQPKSLKAVIRREQWTNGFRANTLLSNVWLARMKQNLWIGRYKFSWVFEIEPFFEHLCEKFEFFLVTSSIVHSSVSVNFLLRYVFLLLNFIYTISFCSFCPLYWRSNVHASKGLRQNVLAPKRMSSNDNINVHPAYSECCAVYVHTKLAYID
uniref:Uncharacterized protein n=1 Tax=Romanomermis culicivorax TaxID=13658 RepID=A0A915KYY8_ROMCU